MISVKLTSLVLVAISISKLVSAVPVPSPSPSPSPGSPERDYSHHFDYNAGEGQSVDDIYRQRTPSPRNSREIERTSSSPDEVGTSTGRQAPPLNLDASASASASRIPRNRRGVEEDTAVYKSLPDDQKRKLYNILNPHLGVAQQAKTGLSTPGLIRWAARYMTNDIRIKLFSENPVAIREAVEDISAQFQRNTSLYMSIGQRNRANRGS